MFMKLAKLSFIFLFCFTAGIGFNSCKSPPPPAPPPPPPSPRYSWVNLNQEIINTMRVNNINFSDIDYRISNSFTAARQSRDYLDVGIENRALRIDEITTRPNVLSFSPDDKSMFSRYDDNPRETFELLYTDNRGLLRFERQGIYLVLVSVMYGNEPYIPNIQRGQTPPVHLQIKVISNSNRPATNSRQP
jgi:hypothetical protein